MAPLVPRLRTANCGSSIAGLGGSPARTGTPLNHRRRLRRGRIRSESRHRRRTAAARPPPRWLRQYMPEDGEPQRLEVLGVVARPRVLPSRPLRHLEGDGTVELIDVDRAVRSLG